MNDRPSSSRILSSFLNAILVELSTSTDGLLVGNTTVLPVFNSVLFVTRCLPFPLEPPSFSLGRDSVIQQPMSVLPGRSEFSPFPERTVLFKDVTNSLLELIGKTIDSIGWIGVDCRSQDVVLELLHVDTLEVPMKEGDEFTWWQHSRGQRPGDEMVIGDVVSRMNG